MSRTEGRAVNYQGCPCWLRASSYTDGVPALRLIERETGEPYAVCTTNIGPIPEDTLSIKDYSENAGMLDFLRELGIVGETLYTVPSGFVKVPVVKLTDDGMELFKEA